MSGERVCESCKGSGELVFGGVNGMESWAGDCDSCNGTGSVIHGDSVCQFPEKALRCSGCGRPMPQTEIPAAEAWCTGCAASDNSADQILRRDPPRPWCAACGEDWSEEPCCDVRRKILALEARLRELEERERSKTDCNV